MEFWLFIIDVVRNKEKIDRITCNCDFMLNSEYLIEVFYNDGRIVVKYLPGEYIEKIKLYTGREVDCV